MTKTHNQTLLMIKKKKQMLTLISTTKDAKTSLSKIQENKSFNVSIPKIMVVILYIHVKVQIQVEVGKDRGDIISSLSCMRRWSRDGQEFLFLQFHQRKLLEIKIWSLLMKEDFIWKDFWKNCPISIS